MWKSAISETAMSSNMKKEIAYLKKKYKSRNPLDIAKEFYDKVPDLDDVSKMQYLDFNMWLRQEILLKADKMSMANSLELRVPFMDIEVFKTAGPFLPSARSTSPTRSLRSVLWRTGNSARRARRGRN